MRATTVALLALALTAALGGCGGGGGASTEDASPASLGPSVEAAAGDLVGRPNSDFRRALAQFLGAGASVAVEPGSATCRPGSRTPSIENPRRYPFACIVGALASSEGLEVEVTLGFVGTDLEGSCWRAANERFLLTGTRPTALGGAARRPVNRIAGCV